MAGRTAATYHGTALLVSPSDGDYLPLCTVLQGSPWRLVHARSCTEAWTILHFEPVDIVLAAAELSDAGGWHAVLDETREMHERPPLIVLVNSSEQELWREALDAGAAGVLQRPLAAPQVLPCLERVALFPGRRPPASESRTGAILVVEAPEVASFIQNVLQRHGYRVATCSMGRAPDLLDRFPVELVITNRPDQVVKAHPEVRVLYTCALPDPERLRRIANRTIAVLAKPFRPDELREKVRRLLATPAVAAADLRYRRQIAGLRCPTSELQRLRTRAERAFQHTRQLYARLLAATAARDALWAQIQGH